MTNLQCLRICAMSICVTGLIGTAGTPAQAQQRAGQGGRALDANQQIGTGGVNTANRPIDYRARNDVVTGNVAGGRGFMGTIDYGAPGAFGLSGGGLSSDTIFEFRVNSLASSPQRLNAVSQAQLGSGTSVYRTFTEVPVYRTAGRIVSTGRLQPGSAYQVISPFAGRSGLQIGTQEGLASRRAPVDVLGVIRQADGHNLEINASPLLGVRQLLHNRIGSTPGSPRGYVVPDETTLDKERSSTSVIKAEKLTSGLGVTGVFAQQPAQIAPGLILGQQLRMAIRPGEPGKFASQRVERLEKALFSPLGSATAKPGEDIYLDLLQAMHGQTTDTPTNRPPDQLTQAPTVEPSTLAGELREPSTKKLQEAEQARIEVLKKIYGFSTDQAPADTTDAEQTSQQQLQALLAQLNYDLPPLETLAGDRRSQVNRLLKKAEADLVGGKYFAAASLYRQALVVQPDAPMVRVGLIHAQLGAGMIRSAAYNLRQLFEQHPELIATRYQGNILPSADRLRWVQDELQKLINGPTGAAAPALMMAYLGYQVGSRQLVRYGLAVAQTSSPKDPLLVVLRYIWLDQDDNNADQPDAEQNAPAVEPASQANPVEPAMSPDVAK